MIILEFLNRNNCGDFFSLFDGEQVDDGSTFSSASCFGDFITFLTVNLTFISKEQDIMVSGGEEQVLSAIIRFFATTTGFTYATAFLVAEVIQSLTFDITLMANGNYDIFFCDKVFNIHIGSIGRNFSTTSIAKFLLHQKQIFFNDVHYFAFISQYAFQPVDLFHNIDVFVINFLTFQTGQALQAHIKDCLRLALAKIEFFHQGSFRNIRSRAVTNGLDYFIKIIKSNFQTF